MMKKNTLFRAFLLLTASALPLMASPSLVSEAQRDYNAGRYAEAKAKFLQVQASQPNNAVARNYLRMIAASEQKASKDQLRLQLSGLMVEKVSVREASLESVIAMLPDLAAKSSGDKVKPNFVVQPGVDTARPITLQLSNIPFTEVLRYIGEQGNVKFQIDEYAVRVLPLRGS